MIPVRVNLNFAVLFCLVWTLSVSALSSTGRSTPTSSATFVDISERAPRNIFGMQEWSKENCGIQTCDGFRLQPDPVDEDDWEASTTKGLSASDPVVFVPSEVILSSTMAAQIQQIDPSVWQHVEEQFFSLPEHRQETTSLLPLFQLYVVLLLHYELGAQSPYYPWLNALPRRFYNGVVMTSACFECLPPYVAYLAKKERTNSDQFQRAIQYLQSATGGTLLSEVTASNTKLLDWAYCVAVTRSWEIMNGVRVIVPMVDMLNHAGDPAEVNVQLQFDQSGNCIAYATRDVSPKSSLRLCYGDPTNPSPFFATYGILDQSAPATFCKLMHLQQEMAELQLGFSDLLFYKDTGAISPQVWDLLLYSILKQQAQQDPEQYSHALQGFYHACMTADWDTKNQYHHQYYLYTKQALQNHVDGLLGELEYLAELAKTKDIAEHPRLSLIKQHNRFVQNTFLKVKANIDENKL